MQIEIPLHENNHTTTINLDPIIPYAGGYAVVVARTSMVSCIDAGRVYFNLCGKDSNGNATTRSSTAPISTGKSSHDVIIQVDTAGYCFDKFEIVYYRYEAFSPCVSGLEGFTAKMNFYIDMRFQSQGEYFNVVS